MLTDAMDGPVLATSTVSVSEPVPPSVSVAVVVQRMVSPGELVDVVSVTDASVPRLVPSETFVQA